MVEQLSNPDRKHGAKVHKKSAKREASSLIDERHYSAMHHGNTDTPANTPLLLLNSSFKAVGFSSKKGEKYNGMTAHYHFVAGPELGLRSVMVRRVPCACEACFSQIQTAWVIGTPPLEQPCFQSAAGCILSAVVGDYNEFRLISLLPADVDEDELEDVCDDILGAFEAEISQQIEIGNYGAYEYEDGYYLVEWTSAAFSLEEDSNEVQGCEFLTAGSIVVRGVYWNPVGRAKHWFTPPPNLQRVEHLFRVKYVVQANVVVEQPSDTVRLPNRRDRQRILSLNPLRVSAESHNKILSEIALRARLDYEEGQAVEAAESEEEYNDDHECWSNTTQRHC
jgi:hypothetical protein